MINLYELTCLAKLHKKNIGNKEISNLAFYTYITVALILKYKLIDSVLKKFRNCPSHFSYPLNKQFQHKGKGINNQKKSLGRI